MLSFEFLAFLFTLAGCVVALWWTSRQSRAVQPTAKSGDATPSVSPVASSTKTSPAERPLPSSASVVDAEVPAGHVVAPIPSEFEPVVEPSASSSPLARDADLCVLYATTTGNTSRLAALLAARAASARLSVSVCDVSKYDPELLPVDAAAHAGRSVFVFIYPTYADGTPPEQGRAFYEWLHDTAYDFRVSSGLLSPLRYAVFGCGDRNYDDNFNTIGSNIDLLLERLSAQRILKLGAGDAQYTEEEFVRWLDRLYPSTLAALDRKDDLAAWRRTHTTSYTPEQVALRKEQRIRGRRAAASARTTKMLAAAGAQSNSPLIASPTTASNASSTAAAAAAAAGTTTEPSSCASSSSSSSAAPSTSASSLSSADPQLPLRGHDAFDTCQCSPQDTASAATTGACGDGGCASCTSFEPASPNAADDDEIDSDPEDSGEPLLDVEDMGGAMSTNGKAANGDDDDDDDADAQEPDPSAPVREMVTPQLKAQLTKQGYHVVGTHSAVKICRWTKAQMRGRGGCYKSVFYHIASYQCMEATPSLSCANKCVFCWRHSTNPVTKEWRYVTDPAEELVEKCIAAHVSMIKSFKGVVGVIPQRYVDAFTVRHCALSLVGEPILYPHIGQFCHLLHQRKISTFLVGNGQFPAQLRALPPVTQCYLSVDAATPESLKAVDRPLHADFWERLMESIDILAEKGQRTVFRLTLVKSWNMEEIHNYAALIRRGRPSFVEVKGVTFCGSSKASPMRMTNVPYHEEVRQWIQLLLREGLADTNYELACEHEHSVCFLIADKSKFFVDGVWHTWIDYDRFFELAASGKPFTATDYRKPTPSWAIAGSPERGFDPRDQRFRRGAGKIANSGC